VARVIVTHHHPDHVGLAGWFQSQGASLLMTRTAWLLSRMLVLDEQALPRAEQIAFWRAAGMDADQLAARACCSYSDSGFPWRLICDSLCLRQMLGVMYGQATSYGASSARY
jgi:hypothetical protein